MTHILAVKHWLFFKIYTIRNIQNKVTDDILAGPARTAWRG